MPAIWQAQRNRSILDWPEDKRPEPIYVSEHRIKCSEYILWSNRGVTDWWFFPVVEWLDGLEYMPEGRVSFRKPVRPEGMKVKRAYCWRDQSIDEPALLSHYSKPRHRTLYTR